MFELQIETKQSIEEHSMEVENIDSDEWRHIKSFYTLEDLLCFLVKDLNKHLLKHYRIVDEDAGKVVIY